MLCFHVHYHIHPLFLTQLPAYNDPPGVSGALHVEPLPHTTLCQHPLPTNHAHYSIRTGCRGQPAGQTRPGWHLRQCWGGDWQLPMVVESRKPSGKSHCTSFPNISCVNWIGCIYSMPVCCIILFVNIAVLFLCDFCLTVIICSTGVCVE